MHDTMATTIGWISTAVLVLTLSAQIVRQWRSGSAPDVSPALFVGQCIASLGFLVYSALVGSTVFVVSNALILSTALIGEAVRRRTLAKAGGAGASRSAARSPS